MATDTNAEHGDSYWVEDGRHHHVMRQSELSNFVGMCPEEMRLNRLHPERRRENDATASGTAVHAGIESAVNHLMAGCTLTLGEMTGVAIQEFASLHDNPSFVVVSNDRSTCEANIRHAMKTFHDEIFPTLHPMGSEIPFRRLILHEDDHRVIYANGTVDYHDHNLGLIDWKTASSAHRAW